MIAIFILTTLIVTITITSIQSYNDKRSTLKQDSLTEEQISNQTIRTLKIVRRYIISSEQDPHISIINLIDNEIKNLEAEE